MSEKRYFISVVFWDKNQTETNRVVIDAMAVIDKEKGLSIIAMEKVKSSITGATADIGDVLRCFVSPFKKLSPPLKDKWEKDESMIKEGIFLWGWVSNGVQAKSIPEINSICPFSGGKL